MESVSDDVEKEKGSVAKKKKKTQKAEMGHMI